MSKDRINKYDVALVDSSTSEQVIPIPPSFKAWTLLIVPKDVGGSPGAVTFELQYLVDGEYYTRNPTGTGTLVVNKANVIGSEDVVQAVKAKITCAGTKPNQDAVIEVWGSR